MARYRASVGAFVVVSFLFCVPKVAWAQGCASPAWPDGCSISLPSFIQNGLNWIFLDACNYHDSCWAQMNPPFGHCLGLWHKTQCDLQFLARMEAACYLWSGVLSYPGSGWVDADDFLGDCTSVASSFYFAVNTTFGFIIYNNSQCLCGCNTDTCAFMFLPLPSWCLGGCGSGKPGPCNSVYQQTQLLTLDLESGRVLYSDSEPTLGLSRVRSVSGDSYFLEEWVLAQVAEDGSLSVLGASSTTQTLAESYRFPVVGAPGVEAGKTYLIIEAARHGSQLAEPLVKLLSLSSGEPVARHLPDGRVTFRAGFSPHGALEEVQTIEGNSRAARLLAEDLEVEFPFGHEGDSAGHEGHRSVVFATFEVTGGKAKFISAIPVLPQCCCTDWPQCPV